MTAKHHNKQQPLLQTLRELLPDHPVHLADVLTCLDQLAHQLRTLARAGDGRLSGSIITSLPSIRIEDTALPIAGYSFWDPHTRQWVIRLSQVDGPDDRRFTLLHEFGCIIWHNHQHHLFPGLNDENRRRLSEHAGDIFAVEALVPRQALRRAYRAGEHDADTLARRFGVTPNDLRWVLSQTDIAEPPARSRRGEPPVARPHSAPPSEQAA